MKRLFLSVWVVGMVCALGSPAMAQPLPTIKLHNTFPGLSLERPVWMSEAPDGSGRMFIVEQQGRILIVDKGSDGSKSTEFFNIVDRHPFMENEEGLLSIAFHPDFKNNGLFYVYYNQRNDESHPMYPYRSVISEFKVSKDDPNKADLHSERILLQVQQPFGNHKGGELAFGPDGYLYLGLGDGGKGTDPFNNAQNSAALLGKILRIDVNGRGTFRRGREEMELPYAIPADNPFVKEPDMGNWLGARHEVYAWGLRNPWRYSFDKQTGQLWAGDVGQDLWEEVDVIVKGGNYGWNVREGFHHFKPGPVGAQYIDPIVEYPHRPNLLGESKSPKLGIGMCVVGGYVYRGKKYPALEGVYVFGDFSLGTIFGLRYEDGKLVSYGKLLEQPKNISSFAQDNDGELYAITLDGHVFSIATE